MADSTVETTPAKPQEDWMARRWRPMMGWTYMLTCLFDFVLAPIGWAVLQAMLKQPVTQWMPLTLQGAGLYHVAMGAVLGVAAYGRTQEKLGGASTATTTVGAPSTSFSAPSNNFAPAPSASFNAAPSWGSTPVAEPAAQVTTGFGGKPAPVIPPFPER